MNAATQIPQSEPETERSAGLSFPEVLDDLAARRPDAEAVVAPEGRATYSELQARTNQLALFLRRAGLQTGDRVGILLPNGLRWIVTALAAHRAAHAPARPLDPRC